MRMKWWRLLLVIPLLIPASPAAAAEGPIIPPWCERDISITAVWKAEGTWVHHTQSPVTWFSFTVRADGCTLTGATVAYRTVHVSTDENDLYPASGSVTWEPGDTSTRTVHVVVRKDSVIEPDEEFALEVVCEGSARISAGTFSKGHVLNDDGPTPSAEPVEHHYVCRQ